MPASLRYGFLLGLTQTVATLIVFAAGLHAAGASIERAQFLESLLKYLGLMVIVALGMRAARKAREAQNVESTFGAGARSALALAFFGALFTGLGQWAYMAFMNPEYGELLRAAFIEKHPSMPSDSVPEATAIAYGGNQGILTFLFATIVGLAFAVVLRAALRREAAAQAKSVRD